ncbi:MAG: DUF4340 domain-containing protein [Lewinellaceae bacterium]|nr:DUF4340 domain-containing protein [Lewinellaceae bacterium]
MRNIIILGILLLVLGGAAYTIKVKGDKKAQTLVAADRGFTVKSMDDVRRVVIKHVKMPPFVFDKNNGEWTMDYKYKADKYIMANIGNALTKMQLHDIPAKAATNTIMQSLKLSGIRVDVFTNTLEEPEKTFFIGNDTKEGVGTYMLLEGDPQPYVMYLPGLGGGLRARFEHPGEDYRDKSIYTILPSDIQSITLEYPKNTSSSFIIRNENPVTILPLDNNQPKLERPINQKLAKAYFGYFESIGAEGFANKFEQADSIILKVPYAKLTIQLKDGNSITHDYYSYDDIMDKTNKARRPEDISEISRFFVHGKDDDYFAQIRVVGNFFLGYRQFFE